ncbi:MAG TPA: VCBS repeat-containing protein, partial [Thermoanaerobaculia bacterium]|nr:VCBS repeat-containing protein [Thermoanaerobaculia bacterium]
MILSRAACGAAVLSLAMSLDAAGQCPPAFDAPPSYAYGDLIELEDFDRDGELDALTTARDENAIRLNLGKRGAFRRGAKVAVPGRPQGSAAGDFDGDGTLDVMLGGRFAGQIYFLPGNGDGTFDAVRTVTTASEPYSLHADDLDADGKLDLIVANVGGDIDVHWGRGDGTFDAAPLSYAPAFYPSFIDTGDMNEDGRPDIVVGHETGAVTITTVGPNRTLGEPLRVDTSSFVFGLQVRDVDGDGNLDVVAADPIEFTVALFKGNGDGTVDDRIDIPAGVYTEGIDFGDFNGDGRLDIVVGQSVQQSLAILYANADGTYSEPVFHLAGNNVYDVRVADLDHDGDDDLVASNLGSFAVLFQQFGRGEFPQLASHSVGGSLGPYDVIAADLNGDGIPDAVTANTLHSTISVLFGNANGTLQEAQVLFADAGAYRVIAADLNGDQHLDLVSANLDSETISVLHNRGDGTFHPAAAYETSPAPAALSAGDIDGDGDRDLLVSSPDSGVVDVFLNAGNGTFVRGTEIDGRAPGQTVLADLNADGKLDVALVDREDPVEGVEGHLTLRHGNGDGTFGAATSFAAGTGPRAFATGDFNGDGEIDLLMAKSFDKTLTLLRGVGDGTFLAPVNYTISFTPTSI